MSLARLAAVGLLAFAVALIARAPATLVDGELNSSTGGRLRLVETKGTIWSGAGALELRDPRNGNAISRNVEWKLLPGSVFAGRLLMEVSLEGVPRSFRISTSGSTTQIGDIEISLPAATLAFAEPRLKPLHLSGEMRLRTSGLSLGNRSIAGQLAMQWRDAGSSLSPVSPLGSFEFRLDGLGSRIQVVLATLEGPLQMDGSGAWAIGAKKPEFLALIRVPPELRDQLAPFLRMISVQRDEQTFAVNLE